MYTIELRRLMVGLDYPSSGEALYREIVLHMANYEKIVINMEGITSLPSMFLNTSFGTFIDEYGKDKLRAKVSFVKITKSQAMRLKDYFSRY